MNAAKSYHEARPSPKMLQALADAVEGSLDAREYAGGTIGALKTCGWIAPNPPTHAGAHFWHATESGVKAWADYCETAADDDEGRQ